MRRRPLRFVPWTTILFPRDASLRACQVNVHVRAFEFLDFLTHLFILNV
jgi:hypothetical protein